MRYRDGAARTSWAFVGDERLSDPFLHHTVSRLEALPGWPSRRVTPTAAAAVAAAAATAPALAPAAFVLHCSRCGSTLLCNALRAVRSTAVVAEPGALNDVLLHLAATDLPPDARAEGEALLKALGAALGQQRCGDQQRAVIFKLSSWNVLTLRSQLRRVWPAVPWIFVHRDPVEVGVSQLRDPSGWMSLRTSNPSAAARLLGVQESSLADMAPAQWCALVLARFYAEAATAAEKDPKSCVLIDYCELDAAMLAYLASLGWVDSSLGHSLSVAELAALRAVSGTYSKKAEGNADASWSPDSEEKRREASPKLLSALEKHNCGSAHARLLAHPSRLRAEQLPQVVLR